MSKIILYSTGCPLCAKLKTKLEQANIQYELVTDTEVMDTLGFETVPVLEIEEKNYLQFGDAVRWIKETTNGN